MLFADTYGNRAAAACAFRIHYLSPATQSGDLLFDSVMTTMGTAVECNIAIIAASVPSVIPLIKKCRELTRKGTNHITVGRSHTATGDVELGSKPSPGTDSSMQRKDSMQQGLIDSERIVSRRDVIPSIRMKDEGLSLPDTDDEDISQLYANASRNITKRSMKGSPQSGLQKIEEDGEKLRLADLKSGRSSGR
jgi:hypothetical protein